MLVGAVIGAGAARADICPDGTEAEFCLPPPAPAPRPQPTPAPATAPAPAPAAAAAPPRLVLVDVYRLDPRLLPLGAGIGWQSFSRDLLEPLPQKVRDASPLAAPQPENAPESPFRFSLQPGGYFSERDGWRLRVFGNGFGGPLIRGGGGAGPASITGAQMGLRLDYAMGDLVIGAFGRFGSLWAQGGSLDALTTSFGGRSTTANLGGGGVLVQVARPGWFIGAALGGDGLSADQPLGITSTNAFGTRYSSPSVGGSTFNVATNVGGRIRLSGSQFLEPSALLTLTSLSLGGATVVDGFTSLVGNVPSASSTVGTADIGVTWRAPLQQGQNLLTPSLRLSWLGAGFLGQAPANRITDGFGLATTLPAGAQTQNSGLGLQGALAYTLRDNTSFYVRGGAGFFGAGTSWDLGGGVQVRWGGAPRGSRNQPASPTSSGM